MIHPHLQYAIAQERMAGFRSAAAASRKADRSRLGRPRLPSLRTWAGWTLVNLGFRLLQPLAIAAPLTPQPGDGQC